MSKLNECAVTGIRWARRIHAMEPSVAKKRSSLGHGRWLQTLAHYCARHGLTVASAALALVLTVTILLPARPAQAQTGASTTLADAPVFMFNIPGNLAFLISNEYPISDEDANWGNYSDTINYGGYFDPNKCYVYKLNYDPLSTAQQTQQLGQSYFKPITHAGGPNLHFCDIPSLAAANPPTPASNFKNMSSSGLWSGNFMNWASMQSIDPIRQVLTGGYRVVDRASATDPDDPMPDGTYGPGTPLTVVEKAWNDYFYVGQSQSQERGTDVRYNWNGTYEVQYTIDVNLVGNLTPFSKWVTTNSKATSTTIPSAGSIWYTNNQKHYFPIQSCPNPGTKVSLPATTVAIAGTSFSVPARSFTSHTADACFNGGLFTFLHGLGNRMEVAPVDAARWNPPDMPTLYDPTDANHLDFSTKVLNQINAGSLINYLYTADNGSKQILNEVPPPYPVSVMVNGKNVTSVPLATNDAQTVNGKTMHNIYSQEDNTPAKAFALSSGANGVNGSSVVCGLLSNMPYPCYEVYVRVSVCDPSTGLDGQSLLESNCVLYQYDKRHNLSPHYKPEGLFQKYSQQLRYAIFSLPYNGASNSVFLRASMDFIGPYVPADPVTTSATAGTNSTPIANPNSPEWDPYTGVQPLNPNPAMGITIANAYPFDSMGNGRRVGAGNSITNGAPFPILSNYGWDAYSPSGSHRIRQGWDVSVTHRSPSQNLYYPMDLHGESGALNYVNKFGEYSGYGMNQGYKLWDIVDDMYYAALRYFRNQKNPWNLDDTQASAGAVGGVSAAKGTAPSDIVAIHASGYNFPAVVTWDDPIKYRCSKNFILGISDDHTWNGASSGNYNDIPNLDHRQTNDANNVAYWTNLAGTMEGLTNSTAAGTGSWPAAPFIWPPANFTTSIPGGVTSTRRPTLSWPQWDGEAIGIGSKSTYATTGMAYYMHTNDIRPDILSLGKINGMVTVDTYWVDVTDYAAIEDMNPYLLAAKYGGFAVPPGYRPNSTTALPMSWWNTTGDVLATHLRGDPIVFTGGSADGATITAAPDSSADPADAATCGRQVGSTTSCMQTVNNGRYPRPDNFYTAADSAQMAASLQKAFANMVSSLKAYSTAFSLASASVASGGSGSYASQYSAADWTATVVGSNLTITPGANGAADTLSQTQAWNTDGVLATQLATQPAISVDDGTGYLIDAPAYYGWDTNRRVATWNGSQGEPFRWSNLTGQQQSALYPLTYAGKSVSLPGGGADYVNYLRGDRTNEIGSNITGGANALRQRDLLLGDIVDAKLTTVGPPEMLFSDNYNPGYGAFKNGPAASRSTMIYVGANDGMLHAFNGSLTRGGPGGTEAFAYVPSALFQPLPSAGDGALTAPNNALAWLGNPNYAHHFLVDATSQAFDVDFDRAGNPAGTGSPDWHTILVGGLGKGGRSFYALDVTDPDGIASGNETELAQKVLWEFTAPDMGYSYGTPIAIKTAQYGWVIALTSGYGNSDGVGHLYLVNPKTGQLLREINTSAASNGVTQATAYVSDYTDYTADAIYAGDLDGQLWRFDLASAASSAPATLLARLTDPSGAAQPITTAPLIEIHPVTNKRYVLVGTGQLLNQADILSTQVQDFYAIIDGTPLAFSTVNAPITRSSLTRIQDVTAVNAVPETSQGWYLDLNSPNYNFVKPNTTTRSNTSATGERVLMAAAAYGGMVAFGSQLMTSDPCLPTVGNLYVLDFSNGQTTLPGNAAYLPQQYIITGLLFHARPDGNIGLLVGDSAGKLQEFTFSGAKGTTVKLLNWRSVPLTGN